ncbi:cyclic nucleotide-binding domain-containing protein [Candidatus Peregrinibacteria bacterium]|nr:cyclic nucleotide-binding domain-containing protein [Candidatus Peregrinibacteria bacterium]
MDSKILQGSQTRTYKKDDIILNQNEEADGMYVINSGQVAVEIDGDYVTTLKDGDFFGEIALMLHEPRSATIRVISDELSVQFISKEKFEEIKESLDQDVLTQILQRLSDNYER